jgi:hypothetical protein
MIKYIKIHLFIAYMHDDNKYWNKYALAYAAPGVVKKESQTTGIIKKMPSIEHIARTEIYDAMTKFDIDCTEKVNVAKTIYIPQDILRQYQGEEKNSRLQHDLLKDAFAFWYRINGSKTEMLLIPKSNYELLRKIGNPTTEFIKYFNNKTDLKLVQNATLAYHMYGIPRTFRRPGNIIRFRAKNEIFVHMEKMLNPNR